MTSLTGLRHLTTLRALHVDRCKEITDLTEVGELTGLTDLDLNGCAGIEDLTPIGRLTELTRLNLHRCRAVVVDLNVKGVDWRDLSPLAGHRNLRVLRLWMPELKDIGALSGLPGPTAALPHGMAWEAYYGRPVPVHTALTERGVTVSGV
ncbi:MULTISPECIES: hypothetical protein [Streptomyces violaceusniger group]|uniref:Leucine-rich repeat domain-containing protein n=3 Tax=Streptomyces rhizosphaericus TaxID=114699 RepID=A0ABN1SC88_9ACTN|nr:MULTISPECIES: hypothetical protein [Streptomyces violaceusniger group]